MTFMNHDESLQRAVAYFETLSPAAIDYIDRVYAQEVFFKDPFNEVRDLASVACIYRHMFRQVDAPRFVVTLKVLQGSDAFITWNFLFRMKRFAIEEQCVRGATQLRFNREGRIELHRDYWDVAEELYEKLPVLGGLMRLLKRRART